MKDDLVFVRHILDEICFLIKETESLTYDQLLSNETLERAILRSLEVIGEASKNISQELKQKHPDIEWKEMAGLRDKLIHFYFGVDWAIVWDVIKVNIPELKIKLEIVMRP